MNRSSFNDVQVKWRPDENSGKVMKKFKKIIEDKYNIKFAGYWDFHKWSIENIRELWTEMWDFTGIVCSKKYDQVIDFSVPLSQSPEWFSGARLNFGENLLKYRDDRLALILAGEDKETEKLTYAQMYEEVKLYAAAFRKLGLKKGDIVVCQMSNRKEAVLAMIAVTSIGAIWTGALPQIGSQAVLSRFHQVSPRIYLTVDRFSNEGNEIQMLEKVKVISDGLPSLEKVIIVATKEDSHSKDISRIKNSCFLDDFLESGREKDGSVPEIQFEQVSFSHPVFINYTSGTTGLPKAIVHGFGGLLAAVRDLSIHTDCDRDSVWFSISPVGWVSWNVYTTLHSVGCTVILFEGIPYSFSSNNFWNFVEENNLTHTFVSTSVVDQLRERNCVPTKNHSLKSLKLFMAGGSVVKPQSYDFMYEKVRKDLPFSSAFGSTEMMGSCMIVEMTIPIYKGEIPATSLGVIIETVDDNGKPVIGELGELVATLPMPNMPLGLWGDEDGSEYRKKYFSKYNNKFAMSDYGIINPVTRGIVICCRSDETLKQRGWRFGSSEIYNIVDPIPEIRDSLCVSHYNKDKDENAVLFLKIRDGYRFNDELVGRVRAAITRELTAHHVPDVIIEIQDIPYNINGKKMEIIVKKIINNMPYNSDTVSNPESLKYYFDIPELRE